MGQRKADAGIAIQKIIRVKQGDHTCRFSHAVSRVDRKLKISTFLGEFLTECGTAYENSLASP